MVTRKRKKTTRRRAGDLRRSKKKATVTRKRATPGAPAGGERIGQTAQARRWTGRAFAFYVLDLTNEVIDLRRLKQERSAEALERTIASLTRTLGKKVTETLLVTTPDERTIMRMAFKKLLKRMADLSKIAVLLGYPEVASRAETDRTYVDEQVVPKWQEARPREDPLQIDMDD